MLLRFLVRAKDGSNVPSFNLDRIDFGDGPNGSVLTTPLMHGIKIIIGVGLTSFNGKAIIPIISSWVLWNGSKALSIDRSLAYERVAPFDDLGKLLCV
jgi:hypothetical protein